MLKSSSTHPAVTRFLIWLPHHSVERRSTLFRIAANDGRQNPLRYVITRISDGQVLGLVELRQYIVHPAIADGV
jgi:hypothetical protein